MMPANRGLRGQADAGLAPYSVPLIELLESAVRRGTGRGAALDGFSAGKTGTTEDYRDAWFIGFNEQLVVGVWVGNDDNSPLPGTTGGGVPAQIWRNFMTEALGIGTSRPVAPVPLTETDRVTPPPATQDNVQEAEPQPEPAPAPAPGSTFPVRPPGPDDGRDVPDVIAPPPVPPRNGPESEDFGPA